MSPFKFTLLSAIILSSSSIVQAQERSEPSFALGISSYATAVIVDTPSGRDDWSFGGAAINATLAFNNNIALRGHLYSQSEADNENIEVSGYDIQALFGSNLTNEGLKYYLALGLYSEELNVDIYRTGYRSYPYYPYYPYYTYYSYTENYSRSMTGLMLGFGLGYNWSRVALDFTVSIRDAQPYADTFEELNLYWSGGTVAAASGAFSLAYRF